MKKHYILLADFRSCKINSGYCLDFYFIASIIEVCIIIALWLCKYNNERRGEKDEQN